MKGKSVWTMEVKVLPITAPFLCELSLCFRLSVLLRPQVPVELCECLELWFGVDDFLGQQSKHRTQSFESNLAPFPYKFWDSLRDENFQCRWRNAEVFWEDKRAGKILGKFHYLFFRFHFVLSLNAAQYTMNLLFINFL